MKSKIYNFITEGGVYNLGYKLLFGCSYNSGNKGIWCPYKTLKLKKNTKKSEFGVPIRPLPRGCRSKRIALAAIWDKMVSNRVTTKKMKFEARKLKFCTLGFMELCCLSTLSTKKNKIVLVRIVISLLSAKIHISRCEQLLT